jgi:hypothetical protein
MRTPVRAAPTAARPAPRPEAVPGDTGAGASVVRLVPLEAGFYAFTMAGSRRRREPIAGLPLPALHVCEAQENGGLEITDEAGGAGSWLGGGSTTLFVKSFEGGAAVVTGYLSRQPDAPPLELEIRRLDRAGGAGIGASLRLRLDPTDAAAEAGSSVALDAVAHIRGRGDVRFANAAVIGRLGSGLWLEAFTIGSPDAAAAAAIEYKGLSASGSETPWLACGHACGETGAGIPLLGFAVRQRVATLGGTRFDCEYTGYFQSGAVIGPLRNGAPCRSMRDADPLEGIELRVTPRPARGGAPAG